MTMPAAILMSRVLKRIPVPSISDYVDMDELGLRSFCIAFQPDEKIHLFPPSKQTAHLLKDTVAKHWTLAEENPAEDRYTLILQGTPFIMYTRRESALLIKYICCLILEKFKDQGWELVVCTDLSSKTDLTAWYFSRMPLENEKILENPIDINCGFVCLSLSTTKKLQLINASDCLKNILREAVVESYEPGIEQDAHYGRDYEIKLKGNPWDTENRDEIVSACKVILATFRQFCIHGYHLYGLVNLKETADSFFFEYDPNQTYEHDRYMIMALDDHNIIRLIHATSTVVQVVKTIIDRIWLLGIEAEGQIGSGRNRSPMRKSNERDMEEQLSWEFVLKGSPWNAAASKLGRSRQFITILLDALLTHGWTVVTGLDISRSMNKKSALLFQRCPPVHSIRHVCMSPLGKQSYQLINAPMSLRRLVRSWFDDVVGSERTSNDKSIYEITFSGPPWWVQDPEEEQDSYIYVRKQMGGLLQALMDGGWRVIASADVARQTHEDDDVGEGIHSWFVIFCGLTKSDCNNATDVSIKVTANSVLQVSGRIGSPKACRIGSERRSHEKSINPTRSASCRPVRSSTRGHDARPRRALSPPHWDWEEEQWERRKSQSEERLSWL